MRSSGNSHRCRWERRMRQPRWKTGWWLLTKLNILSPYNPAVVLLRTYPNEMKTCIHTKTYTHGGFPGGAVVESVPANAGDTGLSPGLGGSHMPRSNWAHEPQLPSLRSTTREAAIVRGPRTTMKNGPHSPQLEKALAQKRRPNTAKNK